MRQTIVLLITIAITYYFISWRNRRQVFQATDIDSYMAKLSEQAVSAAKHAYALKLNFELNSIEQVEQILAKLNAQHKENSFNDERLDSEALLWGAYVGETIKRVKSAQWRKDSHDIGENAFPLVYNGSTESFPCVWCYKRITNGPEENIWDKTQTLISTNT
jgi:hypothetical protein